MGSFDYLLHDNTDNTDNTGESAPEPASLASDRSSNVSIVSIVSIVTPSSRQEFEERAAIAEFDAGVPRAWAEGVARLQCSQPLPGFPHERWQTILDDAGRFLDRWAVKASDLGWTVEDCFGVDPRAPAVRVDQMGLVPLINGMEIVAITEDSATLQAGGSRLTYRRRKRDGIPVWDLI